MPGYFQSRLSALKNKCGVEHEENNPLADEESDLLAAAGRRAAI